MDQDKYKFGYPKNCTLCHSFDPTIRLTVKPHYKTGSQTKIMLIGQDPTIFKDPDKNRVKEVLMLDQENGQLKRWLRNFIGSKNFEQSEIYATNLIKCTFPTPPSTRGKEEVLAPYFNCCEQHLLKEIENYRPTVVLTLGEPAHKLFLTKIQSDEIIATAMNKAFTGKFYRVKVNSTGFDYSPCLHIKTFRVAETYGDKVKMFKKGIANYFS